MCTQSHIGSAGHWWVPAMTRYNCPVSVWDNECRLDPDTFYLLVPLAHTSTLVSRESSYGKKKKKKKGGIVGEGKGEKRRERRRGRTFKYCVTQDSGKVVDSPCTLSCLLTKPSLSPCFSLCILNWFHKLYDFSIAICLWVFLFCDF